MTSPEQQDRDALKDVADEVYEKLTKWRRWFAIAHQVWIANHGLVGVSLLRKHSLDESDKVVVVFLVSSLVVNLALHSLLRKSWKIEHGWRELANAGHELIKRYQALVDEMGMGAQNGKNEDHADAGHGPAGEVH